jgi:CubicO group peptidase (beta-lactamase class C family)
MARGTVFGAAAMLLSTALGANAAPLPSGALEKVDAIARGWAASGRAPVLAIAVVNDGKVVLERGYGLAEVEDQVPARLGLAPGETSSATR